MTVLVLCLLLAVACGSAQIYPGASNPFKEYAERAFSLKNLDECFCEVIIMNINKHDSCSLVVRSG